MKNPYCASLEYENGEHVIKKPLKGESRSNGAASVKYRVSSMREQSSLFSYRINRLIDVGVVKVYTLSQWRNRK